jgi:hypothetical protein
MTRIILKPASKHHFTAIDHDQNQRIAKIHIKALQPQNLTNPRDERHIKTFGGIDIEKEDGQIEKYDDKSLDASLVAAFGDDIVFRFSEDEMFHEASNHIFIQYNDNRKKSIIEYAPGYIESQLIFNKYVMDHSKLNLKAILWSTNLFFSRWKHYENLRDAYAPLVFRKWTNEIGTVNHAFGKYVPKITEEDIHNIEMTRQLIIEVDSSNFKL